MSVTRRLTDADAVTALALGAEAFGYQPTSPPPTFVVPGRHEWGTFVDDRLVTRVVGIQLESWWGATVVPTTGVAGVAVAAESRGAGLLDEPMRAVLREGRERGEVLAALYPTAPGIYRRYGFEVVTSLLEVELPTASLPLRPAPGVVLRRATAADVETVTAAYDAWARAQHGPLSRRTPTVSARRFLDGSTGVTVAEIDGVVGGYVRWQRGEGYDADSVLVVEDLVVLDPRAGDALWGFLAGWASVAPTLRMTTSGADPARLALRGGDWRVVRDRPYMLRVLDVAGALGLRPAVVDGSAAFAVTADALDGPQSVRLTARDGVLTCEPTGGDPADGPTFTSRGLALWYAGAQTCANLRMAGLLTGPAAYDGFLDRVLERRPLHIRDYF